MPWSSLKMPWKWCIVNMSVKTCSGFHICVDMSLARVREWLLPFRTFSSINPPSIKKAHASFSGILKTHDEHWTYAHTKGSKGKFNLLRWNAQALIFHTLLCVLQLWNVLRNACRMICCWYYFLQILLHSQGNMKSLSFLIHRFIQKWSVFYLMERLPSLSQKLFHPRKKPKAAKANRKPLLKPLVRFQLQHWKSNHVSPVYSVVQWCLIYQALLKAEACHGREMSRYLNLYTSCIS